MIFWHKYLIIDGVSRSTEDRQATYDLLKKEQKKEGNDYNYPEKVWAIPAHDIWALTLSLVQIETKLSAAI